MARRRAAPQRLPFEKLVPSETAHNQAQLARGAASRAVPREGSGDLSLPAKALK